MTALLTDNFSVLASAPNGIKKLRELILELAVRGKLLPQDPREEPASELLKRIAEEKARLVAEGKIKKSKPTNENPAEVFYEIPSTWAVASLGQVVEIVRGITFPASEKSKEPEPGRVACLRTANVQDEIEWDDLLYIRESFVSRHDQYVEPHDIVMSMANSRELVGKVALIGAELKQKTTFGGFLGVLRPVLIEPRFVMALLRTPHARSALIESSSQTTNIANVSLGKLRPLPLAIPPLAEQRRIVVKVDELMALCDRVEARKADAKSAHAHLVQALLDSLIQARDASDFAANWQHLAEHFHALLTTESSINALKQTLLRLAVMGKIAPQNPSDEPAIELLKRITQEKARLVSEGKIRKAKQFPELSDEEKLFFTPNGWEAARFGQVIELISGQHLGPDEYFDSTREGAIPYLTGPADFGETYPRATRFTNERRAISVKGDILLTVKGSGVGKTNFVNQEELAISRQLMAIRPIIVDVQFARNLLLSMSAHFQSKSIGIAIPGISREDVLDTLIGIPPLPEQHRIVAKVDQLMALCDQLKTRLTQARQLNEQLVKTLVERALEHDDKKTPIATDQKTARTLLAAEVTHRLHAQRTFGQRKLQKVVYLAEYAARLDAIQGSYLRNVAGPHDRHLMNQVEAELQTQQWYERIDRETVGHAYRPLSQAGQHRQAYNRTWSANEQAKIEQVIELMRDWDTDRCEMTVTLYAAWNDFIIEGRPVSDDAIVDEVMHRWNEAKLRFSKGKWLAALTEMKKHGLLTPTGFGKRTSGGTLTLPGFE